MSLTFPNVPDLPGVPQLARAALPNAASLTVALGGAVLSSLFGSLSTQNQWGIFDSSGNAVISPDSILSFGHHPRWKISDFPVQGTGNNPTAFASYNKVKLPFDCRVRMSKGGNVSDRKTFLTTLDALAESIDTYSIITPEYTYQNADIEYYDVVRETQGQQADGAFALWEVDVYFKQIVAVQAQYSTTELENAANPSAQPDYVTGVVLPQTPSNYVEQSAGNGSLENAFGAFGGSL